MITSSGVGGMGRAASADAPDEVAGPVRLHGVAEQGRQRDGLVLCHRTTTIIAAHRRSIALKSGISLPPGHRNAAK